MRTVQRLCDYGLGLEGVRGGQPRTAGNSKMIDSYETVGNTQDAVAQNN